MDEISITVGAEGVTVYAKSQRVNTNLMELLEDIRESLNRIYGEKSPFVVKTDECLERFTGIPLDDPEGENFEQIACEQEKSLG